MSDKYIQTNKPGLVRDTFSQAIVASDDKALQEYRNRAKQIKEIQAKVESINIVKEDMNILKEEMDEIKGLLMQIIAKENNKNAS